MRWTAHVAGIRYRRGAYRVLVGIPDRKRPLGRPRHKCENTCNIKMRVREVEGGARDCFDLAQDRDRWAGSCKCGNEPWGSIKCGELLAEVLLDAFASGEGLCSMSYPVRDLTFTPVLPQLIHCRGNLLLWHTVDMASRKCKITQPIIQ